MLLICERHLHDCIISMRGEALAHTNSLTTLFFYIESSVPHQESKRPCVLEVLLLSLLLQVYYQIW